MKLQRQIQIRKEKGMEIAKTGKARAMQLEDLIELLEAKEECGVKCLIISN